MQGKAISGERGLACGWGVSTALPATLLSPAG